MTVHVHVSVNNVYSTRHDLQLSQYSTHIMFNLRVVVCGGGVRRYDDLMFHDHDGGRNLGV